MTQPQKTLWRWAFFIGCAVLPAFAQQNVQFLPEVDTCLKLNSVFRVYVEAKDDQDGGNSAQAGIGPSVQLYLKPLAKLKTMRAFDLDDAKSRFLVLETGYRYIGAPDTPTENRMITEAVRVPIQQGRCPEVGQHPATASAPPLDFITMSAPST